MYRQKSTQPLQIMILIIRFKVHDGKINQMLTKQQKGPSIAESSEYKNKSVMKINYLKIK